MKKIRVFLAAGLLAASSVSARTYSIYIDTVQVEDTDNNPDSTTGYGNVDYSYHIGTYEVTNSQYTAFLTETAADADPHGLYNSKMGSSDHGGIVRSTTTDGGYSYSVRTDFEDKPVNFVSFWDAARFTNWLTSGNTEEGVYRLTVTGIRDNSITRNTTAWNNGGVAIASENEWYKAAYYDGHEDDYNDYPTNSDDILLKDANYDNSVGSLTDVGYYKHAGSHYGTFDQGGNVWEWNDEIVSDVNRGLRGGSVSNGGANLQSSFRFDFDPASEFNGVGFRVSSLNPIIPEPSAYAAILGCLGLGLALMRRKGRGTH